MEAHRPDRDPAYDWNLNGISDRDIMNIMFPCEKDNLEIFKTNGTYEHNEGATKCNTSDPQSWGGTWVFSDNELKMIIDGVDEYTILELTDSILRYQSVFLENGVSYNHKEIWGH